MGKPDELLYRLTVCGDRQEEGNDDQEDECGSVQGCCIGVPSGLGLYFRTGGALPRSLRRLQGGQPEACGRTDRTAELQGVSMRAIPSTNLQAIRTLAKLIREDWLSEFLATASRSELASFFAAHEADIRTISGMCRILTRSVDEADEQL